MLPALLPYPHPAHPDGDADLTALIAEAERYGRASRSVATHRARASDWRAWTAFTARLRVDPYEATTAVAVLYVTDLARSHRWSTIQRHLSTVAGTYRRAGLVPPTDDARFKEWCGGVANTLGTKPLQKPPVSVDGLRAMCSALPDTVRGRRDVLVVSLGFGSLLRRSELTGLDIADVTDEDDRLLLQVRRSKVDQSGSGRLVIVPAAQDPTVCPLRHLRRWLDATGLRHGPLLRPVSRRDAAHPVHRLQPRAVADIVRRAAYAAELPDADLLAGHSLRSGACTAMVDAGVSTWAATRASGHASERTFGLYVRFEAEAGADAVRAIGL